MYREVTMIELKEVLRLRGEGLPKKRLAAQLGLDPKTVRRYLAVAASVGVQAGAGAADREQPRGVPLAAPPPRGGPPRGKRGPGGPQRTADGPGVPGRAALTKIP